MSEKEPRPTVSIPFGEDGSQRFSLRRVLIGAAVGAVALPLAVFGISSLVGVLSQVPPSEIPTLARLGGLLTLTGAAIGGLRAAIRR